MAWTINEDGSKKETKNTNRGNVAVNQGPSTPVKNYGGNMGFQKNSGAGRVTNVRPKKGLTLKDVYK